MRFDNKIRCYDCHTLSVEYNAALDVVQVCRCELCGEGYKVRVYSRKRLVVLGRHKNV